MLLDAGIHGMVEVQRIQKLANGDIRATTYGEETCTKYEGNPKHGYSKVVCPYLTQRHWQALQKAAGEAYDQMVRKVNAGIYTEEELLERYEQEIKRLRKPVVEEMWEDGFCEPNGKSQRGYPPAG